MSGASASELDVLRERVTKAERAVAALSSTIHHAREHAARRGTKSAAWEEMRDVLRPGHIDDAMQLGEQLRRRAKGEHGTRAQLVRDLANRCGVCSGTRIIVEHRPGLDGGDYVPVACPECASC